MKRKSQFVLAFGLSLLFGMGLFGSFRHPSRVHGSKRQLAQSSTSPAGQTATLMPDGRILLTGGEGPDGPLANAALRDPQTGVVTPLTAQLKHPRAWHTATVLPDGTVLIFGGIGTDGHSLGFVESFDVATQTFRTLPAAGLTPRAHHTATLLTDGRLLISGGVSDTVETLDSAELLDSNAKQRTGLEGRLRTARKGHTATLLPDGTVLLWGGTDKFDMALTYGEVFDPVTGGFRIETSAPATAADGNGPIVEASIPGNQDSGVPVDSLIALRFSHPIAVKSASTETMQLTGPDGAVPIKVIPAEAGMLAFVTPNSLLTQGTEYTLSLRSLDDRQGLGLPDTYVSFTTAGKHDPGGTGLISGAGTPEGASTDSAARNFPPLQAPSGVTALAGQALNLNGAPLEGVTLRIDAQSAKTDGTGRFLLRDISAGHHAMVIDGRTANNHKIVYGVYEAGVDITGGSTTALNYKIWMTPLDTAHAVSISFPTVSEVVVKTPLLPGLEFHIPPNTTITDTDGKVASQISITAIPVNQPPFPLPAGVRVPIYFTIQPGGGYIHVQGDSGPKGARLIYPNAFNSPPGTRFDFWNYSADDKGWFVYGHGSVSADKKSIVPDPGVEIYELTGAMVASSGMAPSTGPGPFCRLFHFFCAADPVDSGTGLFVYDKTDLYLPDVIPIKLMRTYRPNDSASRSFGVGTTNNYDIFLVGDRLPYTYQDLVLADGSRIHYTRTSPGTSWIDAVYQSNWSPGPYFFSTIVWNGNGWTLTLRDGTVYQFPVGDAATRGQMAAVLSILDRNGNTLTMSRDTNSNLTQVTSPNGRWIRLTYDTNFRVTQAQDNIGRTVQYSYDPGGRLTQVIDVNGGTWKYSYDSSNNMTALIDPRNITYLQNQYDSQNRVIKQTLADGVSAYRFVYNPMPCGTNCSGIWETDTTDPNGNVEKDIFNPAPIFSNGFTTAGPGSTVTYAAGTSIAQTYSFQYKPGTNFISSIIDPLNRTTSYTYDSLGNVTSITRLAGTSSAVTSSFSYELKYSKTTSVTDPLNHTTSFSYDPKGNLISATDALGNTSTFASNPAGQIVSVTDPLGNTAQLAYDGADLTAVTDPLGRSVTFFTDGAGRRVSTVNPLGQRTKFSYNPLNQISQIVDPMSGVTSFSYDPNGNLMSVTDPRNTSNPTTYTYDNMDRLATRKDPLGNQESYQYDADSNLTQFTDRRGKVATFNYDALNRPTFAGYGTLAGPTYESTVNYSYDAGNRLTQVLGSISGTIARGYDGLNRLTSDVTPQGTVSYTYDAAGRRVTLTVPGQSVVNYTFDNANRLAQITQGTSTVRFGYDNANRRTTLTLPNGITTAYSYDTASELTGLTYTNGSNTLGNLSYSYDLVGRRTSAGGSFARTGLPNPVSAASYNANNQLTTWGTANLFYDANGNMTSDGTHSYTWDARNRLTKIDSGATASFGYDPFGRRYNKNILGTSTNFLYDGANAVQEVIGGTNTANSLMGGIDEVFQRTDSSGARSFLTDALGSTLALADSTGTLQTQYTFEPFGNATQTGAATTNSFAYTGRELDAGNLYFYRARYYNPQLQRFISEDPIGFSGGDVNLYAYTRNSPTNHTDASGKIIDLNALGDAAGNFALNHANYIPAICSADSFRFYGGGGGSENIQGGAYQLDDVHYSNTSADGWHVDGMESDMLYEAFGEGWGGGAVMHGRKPKEALLFPPSPYHVKRKLTLGPVKLRGELGLGPLIGYSSNGLSVGFYGDVGLGGGIGNYGGGGALGGGWSVTFSSAASCLAQ